MLGYALIIACGSMVVVASLIGSFVTARCTFRAVPRSALKATFIAFAITGISIMAWAGFRVSQTYWHDPGIVDIELSANDSEVQLQRVAATLGLDPRQASSELGNDIVERLSSHDWRLSGTQAKALGQALDAVPVQDRFPIIVRSIPSNADSVTFSDDVGKLLRRHGWVATSRRDFGINQALPGIMIAVGPDVRSEAEVPLAAKRTIVMLEKAGFTPYGGVMKDLGPGEFQLVIGSRSQIAAEKLANSAGF